MSIVLGIDPGSKYTGVGVIKKNHDSINYIYSAVISLPVKSSFGEKLYFLSQELEKIYLKYPITETAVEKIFFGKNADSAFKLGHVRGVCFCAAGRHGVQVFEYAAKYAKKVVTGSGASDKDSVQAFINRQLGLSIEKIDESDALAISLCHALSVDMSEKMNRDFRI